MKNPYLFDIWWFCDAGSHIMMPDDTMKSYDTMENQFNINVNDYLLLQGIVSCIKKCIEKSD